MSQISTCLPYHRRSISPSATLMFTAIVQAQMADKRCRRVSRHPFRDDGRAENVSHCVPPLICGRVGYSML